MSSFASFEFELIGAILNQSLDAIVRVFHVRKQRTRLGVSFAAQMTRESVFRVISDVYVHVAGQLVLPGEALAAYLKISGILVQ